MVPREHDGCCVVLLDDRVAGNRHSRLECCAGVGRDVERQSYLEQYLAGASRAVAQGVPLRGYFAWSLLDNFEWAWGYWKRFGLVFVDYATLDRVPKGSFYWYRDYIAGQRERATGAEAAA